MKGKKKIILIISMVVVAIIIALVLLLVFKNSDKQKIDQGNQAENNNASSIDINKNEEKDKVSSGVKITAQDIEENASTYYGATVTNYTANGISDWKVFLSDGGNVYLISSDYIPIDKVPATKGGNSFHKGAYEKGAPLKPVAKDSNYSGGSSSISNKNLSVNWLGKYLDSYTSSEDNMKAVAYLLDTDVWNIYKTDKADYAIGGPTIEMLFESYNKKYNVDYQADVLDEKGYQISKDGGETWDNYYLNMLDKNDSLYVLGKNNGAYGMWISSPSFIGKYQVMISDYKGDVTYYYYDDPDNGFRPIVCLKSNVEIEKNSDGSVTIK